MYDTQAEDKFLNYATYMILDRTKKSSDYSEPIFSEPLPNAKFNDQFTNIDTSWRNTSAMTPLFVQTQQSQSQTAGNDITLAEDELKATQSTFEFSMTLDGGAQGIRSQLGGSSTSNSTLLFRNPAIPEDSAGGDGRGFSQSQMSAAGTNQKYRRLQYRSVKSDQGAQSQMFKRAFENKMQTKMLLAVDREIARAKSVSMIRKYRDGDLPDIQISYSDIIRPLQNLAEMDVDICRMLFSKLVTSLMGQVDSYNEMVRKRPWLGTGNRETTVSERSTTDREKNCFLFEFSPKTRQPSSRKPSLEISSRSYTNRPCFIPHSLEVSSGFAMTMAKRKFLRIWSPRLRFGAPTSILVSS